MAHSSESHPTVASLQKEVRRMRIVFGVSLIAMALMLMIVLPSIIKNTLFRAEENPDSAGHLTNLIYHLRGEEAPQEIPAEIDPDALEAY